jgi:uncharacterized RDD family membrane protein YckC
VVAVAIDLAPFLLLGRLVAGPVDASALRLLFDTGTPPPRLAVASIGLMVCFPLYGMILEYLYGATLGKMVMRLRVVADGGARPTFREILLRNISKSLEMVFVLLVVVMLLSKRRRRFGDLVAWTAVVDAESLLPPSDAPGNESAEENEGDQDADRNGPARE